MSVWLSGLLLDSGMSGVTAGASGLLRRGPDMVLLPSRAMPVRPIARRMAQRTGMARAKDLDFGIVRAKESGGCFKRILQMRGRNPR